MVGWLAGWLADWLAGWVSGWVAGWLANWLACKAFFCRQFHKNECNIACSHFEPSGAGLAGWMAGPGWLAGWLAGPAAWLAGGLAGWLAGWLAVWLAGWLACASFGIFFLTVSQKWMHH